nr:EOG090X03T7 [Sida crystallina]
MITFFCYISSECHNTRMVWWTLYFHVSDHFQPVILFIFSKTHLLSIDDLNYLLSSSNIYSQFTINGRNLNHSVTLAVLDRGYFLEYYGNSTVAQRAQACSSMFHKINKIAYDSQCNDIGREDFLRKVPCPSGKVCPDEDKPENVVQDYQFTYVIQDLSQPRFWYVSLVACYRDISSNCTWKPYEEDVELDYDIWLVNGNPYAKNQNPLEYQFSFDNQDTVEIFLLFLVCYLFLTPLQVYAVNRQKHPVPKLFTMGLLFALTGVFLNVVHCLKFAFDGEGVNSAAITGGVFDILSQTLLMLLLLLLAKGWAITHKELTWKPVIYTIWAMYGLVHVLLYVWDLTEVDVIDDIDEYQTWPGWLMLILRTVIMAWFLYCLRSTMAFEHQKSKLDFFLHFGAASLVWFIYLPIVALIALQVSVLWRKKLLIGICYSANFLAYAVMAHLLWPTRSQQYFLLANEMDLGEELDEFDEAPHVVNPTRTPLMRKPTVSRSPAELDVFSTNNLAHDRIAV